MLLSLAAQGAVGNQGEKGELGMQGQTGRAGFPGDKVRLNRYILSSRAHSHRQLPGLTISLQQLIVRVCLLLLSGNIQLCIQGNQGDKGDQGVKGVVGQQGFKVLYVVVYTCYGCSDMLS